MSSVLQRLVLPGKDMLLDAWRNLEASRTHSDTCIEASSVTSLYFQHLQGHRMGLGPTCGA